MLWGSGTHLHSQVKLEEAPCLHKEIPVVGSMVLGGEAFCVSAIKLVSGFSLPSESRGLEKNSFSSSVPSSKQRRLTDSSAVGRCCSPPSNGVIGGGR